MMIRRVIILLLLVLMVIFVGCGEDDLGLGGVAKVTGTLPSVGSQIDSDGVLVITFDDSSNIEDGTVTVNDQSLLLVGNQATIDYSGLAEGGVTVFIVSWKNTDGTISIFNASFHVIKNTDSLAQEITWEKDGAKMALILAGSFEMGDSKNEPLIEDWFQYIQCN